MQCKRLDSLHLLGRSSPVSAGETWDVVLSWTAAVQYIIWNISCCSPFQVMCPVVLLYEQLFRGLLGTTSPVVLSCMLDERSWVASARLRATGVRQSVPGWGHGILLHTGEFPSWLANSGFVKLFSFASHEKTACLNCGDLVVLEHWVCSGAQWQLRLYDQRERLSLALVPRWRPTSATAASFSCDECSSYLGSKVSDEAGCTAASSTN